MLTAMSGLVAQVRICWAKLCVAWGPFVYLEEMLTQPLSQGLIETRTMGKPFSELVAALHQDSQEIEGLQLYGRPEQLDVRNLK